MTADTQPPPAKRSFSDKRRQSVCVGCGSQIHDQFILRVAPDLEWHASCLKCAECSQFLDESCTCFVRDGKTYCRRDYVRIFGAKCSKCNLSFGKGDFVMRAREHVYHIDCFRCVACSRQLIPGDEFALRDDGLFCKADHDVVERASSKENGSDDEASRSSSTNNNLNNSNSMNNITKCLNKNARDNDDNNNNNSNEKSQRLSSSGRESITVSKSGGIRGHGKSEQKPTRVRTVLNEKQLHTLRTCYNANPRPDALMKEQLTEMTGLSPRVIRVWFQNKRCKDKKRSLMMKQLQQQQQDKGGGRLHGPLQGVPMVASSPVRHESPLQANPVEVTSYQPPWKALSEFALQSDLDHPPFQQLMNSFDMDSGGGASPYHGDCYPSNGQWLSSDQMVDHMESMDIDRMDHVDQYSDSDFARTPSEMSSPLSQ